MLEEKINPVLTQLRAEDRDRKDNYGIVRAWFLDHTENLAPNLKDLTFVCKLPDPERTLVTYPVMGNWYLGKMAKTRRHYSEQQYSLLRELIAETRFNNHHTKCFYEDTEGYNKKLDEFNASLLSDPDKAVLLDKSLIRICEDIFATSEALYKFNTYTIDLGHGFNSPAVEFSFLTLNFRSLMESKKAAPLGLTIMVVDDQQPEQWYRRMIAVGFEDNPKQDGFFFDCETALSALENGHYDVVLSDLDLEEGKMDGIEFVEKAHPIQVKKGIIPRISVFSYSNERLKEVEKRLNQRDWTINPLVFRSVENNNKARFTAIGFRRDVTISIILEERERSRRSL